MTHSTPAHARLPEGHRYSPFRTAYAEHGGAGGRQDAYGVAERSAQAIAEYQPLIVPGLLQTASYTREVLSLTGGLIDAGAHPKEFSDLVASRTRRAAILSEPGHDITLLVGEGALRNRLASVPVMREQLEHIARLAETLTGPTIGIVAFERPAPVMAFHGWVLTDDVVTVETTFGDLDIAEPGEVGEYREHTRLLAGAALRGADAAALCRRIATDTAAAP